MGICCSCKKRAGRENRRGGLVFTPGSALTGMYNGGLRDAFGCRTTGGDRSLFPHLSPARAAEARRQRCRRKRTDVLGLVLRDENKQMIVRAELFWQQPTPWLRQPQPCGFPLTYTLRQGARHPLRPPKPAASYTSATFPGSVLLYRFAPSTSSMTSNRSAGG